MNNLPTNLKYSETHEWARVDEEGIVTIGITDHAQGLLGDVVFLELPEVDAEVNAGDEVGVIESVKAASDLYSPVSGTVIAVNDGLEGDPALVNSDPYGEGWLFRVQMVEEEELDQLMDAKKYAVQVASEGH
jgi:glycine cleavage system H protein